MCVAGAGRGGIVARCLAAVVRAGRSGKAHIYALEKNPNACITYVHALNLRRSQLTQAIISLRLEERKASEWGDHVSLVFGDMRKVKLPKGDQVDILVSELLGSFGDNELSPECLDGAVRLLKRKH